MKTLYDAVNSAVIIRWPSIHFEKEKVGGELLAMYMFRESIEFDFVVNFINDSSLQVYCWKRKGRNTHTKDFKFISGDDFPYHVNADGTSHLLKFDLNGQANYIVNEIANFFNPPVKPA